MADTPQSLAEKLTNEAEKTLEFFRELQESGWEVQVYGELEQEEGAGWKIREVFTHFVSAEEHFHILISNIVAGGEGAPEGFDIDRFNNKQVRSYETMSGGDLLERFATLRQKNIAMVAGLTEEDLSRVGRHPFLGQAPLVDMIKLIYRHNQLHQRDIRRIL